MKRKKRSRLPLIFGAILVGTGIYTFIQQSQQAQACGSAQGPIVGPPSVSAQTLHSAFTRQSGTAAELQDMGTALYIVSQSNQYQIDDAFAMADWQHEGNYGTAGVAAQTRDIGNITIAVPFDGNHPRAIIGHTLAGDPIYALLPTDKLQTPAAGFIIAQGSGLQFPVYNTWQDGIHAWFVRVKGYVDQGITDYERFAFYYDLGIFSPSAAQMQNPPAEIKSYVQALQDGVTALRQQNGGGSASGSTSSVQLPPYAGWATPAAKRDAQKLGLFNCTDTHTLVGAAMNLAFHLTPRTYGPPHRQYSMFNLWDAATPQPPAESLGGVVQCVSFVKSVYRMATGKSVPDHPDAALWWPDYRPPNQPGFTEIVAGPGGGWPAPGDFVVLWNNNQPWQDQDGHRGHIAVVVGVQLPQAGQAGFILIAQANATSVLDEWPLYSDHTVAPYGDEYIQGFIRLTSH